VCLSILAFVVLADPALAGVLGEGVEPPPSATTTKEPGTTHELALWNTLAITFAPELRVGFLVVNWNDPELGDVSPEIYLGLQSRRATWPW